MKKIFVFGLAVVSACLIACGDDSSVNSSNEKTSESGADAGDDTGNVDNPSNAEKTGGSSTSTEKKKSSSSSAEADELSSSSDDGSALKVWSWDTPKENFLNPKIKYKTITDERDHKTYKVIEYTYQKLHESTPSFTGMWIAENLNYESEGSWCFDNEPEKCTVAGRLYSWSAAQKACPEGWRLPSDEDWVNLFGSASDTYAGSRLKSKTGWTYVETNGSFSDYNGDDVLGFSAIPAGLWSAEHKWYAKAGEAAAFWSSTEADDKTASRVFLGNSKAATISTVNKNDGYSVRCVQDKTDAE